MRNGRNEQIDRATGKKIMRTINEPALEAVWSTIGHETRGHLKETRKEQLLHERRRGLTFDIGQMDVLYYLKIDTLPPL